MKKTKLFISFLFSLITIVIYAQENTITGTVTSNNLPIPGVDVMIKGTTIGTSTDFDGVFSINATATDILVFSYVGLKTTEVVVGGKNTIDVSLEEEIAELGEIVLIGYGSSKKKDITGAVSSVKGEELEKRNVTNIQEALSGQLPGVQVRSGGGAPGSEASITVRGFSTLNNNAPLFVVDDVPLDDISFLTPSDIESIQVLKDASAAAIFGSRASNGVIIIKTKKGKEGRTTFNFDAFSALQTVARSPNMADATEYANTINAARLNDGDSPLYQDPASFGRGTNWFDEVTQTALFHNAALNITSGTEKLKVSSGFSYQDQEGIQRGGDFERITARLNSEYKLLENLTITQNFSIGKSFTTNGPNLVSAAQRLEPTTSPFLPVFEQGSALNEFSIFSPTITDVPNALGILARNFNNTEYLRGLGSVSVNWEIVEGLSLKTQFSTYFSSFENNSFTPNYFIEPNDQQQINSINRTHNNRTNITWNNLLTYTKDIKEHSFTILGGFIMEGLEHRTLFARGQNIPSNNPNLRFLEAATEGFFASGNNENYNLLSYVGRLNYSFKDTYILNASIRADGSSLFPEGNRWGVFPSVSGAWLVSEEDFIKNNQTIDYLKLRVGWGQIGNDNRNSLPVNARLTTIANDFYTVGSGQDLYIATGPGNVGNSNLKWETVEDINLGVDINLFDYKLGVNLDLYQRKTYDMLMPKSIPSYLGSGFDAQWANVGNFETQGIDLGINYNTEIGKVNASFTLNLSHFNPRATRLADGEAVLDGNDQRLDILARTIEGERPSLFFGYVTAGVFQNQTEVNSHTDQSGNLIQPLAQPGDFRFADLNGDGQLTDEDRKIIGDPTPDFIFGFNINLTYNNFDFNALFNGSYGNDMINAARPYSSNGGEIYNSYAGILSNSWSGEGTSNSQPRLSIDDPNGNFRYSDYYIEDGSYLRLQNIQLGYNFSELFANKIGLSKFRVYTSVENLFTLTSFSGLETDIGGSATLSGVEFGNYPVPRTISFGLNLGF
jgi:TonB-linked SusC/RagA family outer membrane protein